MNTGPSEIVGEMIKMPLTDGGYTYYPLKYANDALYNRRYSIFVTKGKTDEDVSLLVATTLRETKVILLSSYDKLLERLLEIPWKENRVKTREGVFYRKIAPSYNALMELIQEFKEDQDIIKL